MSLVNSSGWVQSFSATRYKTLHYLARKDVLKVSQVNSFTYLMGELEFGQN